MIRKRQIEDKVKQSNKALSSSANHVAIIQCIGLGTGVFFLVTSWINGNVLILAGPLALWAAVVSLPRNKNGKASRYPSRARRRQRAIKTAGSRFAWRENIRDGHEWHEDKR